jgi:biopolymer transport protein ExbD
MNGNPTRRQRSDALADPLADALALGLMGTALAWLTVALVVVPQRIAQRPAGEGVLTVRVDRLGILRVWNQPIRPEHLPALLGRAATRGPAAPRLRLVPDAAVPWGTVQQLAAELESSGLPLELQLP